MPELPEVETIRKDLEKKIIDKKIIDVKIVQKKSIRNSPNKFIKALQNNYVISAKRKGKLLILELSDKKYILIHLRMTGQLVYKLGLSALISQNYADLTQKNAEILKFPSGKLSLFPPRQSLSSEDSDEKEHPNCNLAGVPRRRLPRGENENNKSPFTENIHTRVILYFEDKSELYFNDLRRFGYLQIASEKEKNKAIEKMGIDALSANFDLEVLKNLFKNKKRTLKSLLLDQKIIAGIGNIYADEICFGAELNPKRKTNKLNDKELQKLYNSIRKILASAIKYRGTTFSDYIDASGRKGNFAKLLKVYGREKENCKNCKKKSIKKIKLAGRTTRFCKRCQK